MIDGQTVLAVIPARGGSKRAPRKNIRPFRGKPLVQWAWEAARESSYIDTLILSTDDEDIRELARQASVTVMHRPAHLASDDASAEDVLRYVLRQLDAQWVVLLQPTSPLRTADDIDRCLELSLTSAPVVSVRPDKSKNGAVYVAKADWLMAGNNFTAPHTAYVMPLERSLDIDYPEQFEEAA